MTPAQLPHDEPRATGQPARGPASQAASPYLPNALVLGAPKCGTTWLYANLKPHPQIAAPRKEIHYFSNHQQRGLDWYEGIFRESYAGEPVRLEVAVNYIYHRDYRGPIYPHNPDVAEDIRATLGQPKMILMVRDPVERALSDYVHFMQGTLKYGIVHRDGLRPPPPDVRRGWQPAAIAKHEFGPERQLESFYTPAAFHQAVIAYPFLIMRGFYDVFLQHYLDIFDREQFLFLEYEQLKRDPVGLLHSVCDFLVVERWHDDALAFRRENTASDRPLPRYWALQSRLLRLRHGPLRPFAERLIAWNLRLGGQKPALDPDTRAVLARWYAPHNRALAQMTGLNLEHWS